jgi:restriction system protein
MARRSSAEDNVFFELCCVTPTWVGPLLIGGFYVLVRYGIPRWLSADGSMMGQMIAGLSRSFAPFVTVILVIIWLTAEVWKWERRRLADRQTSLDSLRALDWHDFELLVGEAYRRQGYEVSETGGGGADGGVDLMLTRGTRKVAVQCKQWRQRQVGVKVVRELYGVTQSQGYEGSRGVVVSCGDFTDDARRFAAQNSVELVDGPALLALVKSVQSPAPSVAAPSSVSEPDPVPAASEPDPDAAPSCPLCGRQMVLRTARRGARAGSQFWGCPGYPACRGTQEL